MQLAILALASSAAAGAIVWIICRRLASARNAAESRAAEARLAACSSATDLLKNRQSTSGLLRALCDAVREHTGARAATFILMDPDTGALQMQSPDADQESSLLAAPLQCCESRALHECIASGTCVEMDSSDLDASLRPLAPEGSQRLVLTPLVNSDTTLGVLAVAPPAGESLRHEAKALLQTAANVAASAVAAERSEGLAADDLYRIKLISEIAATLGPHASPDDVKRAVVQASSTVLSSDHVGIFTIDPCLGGIECEANSLLTEDLQGAFLRLWGDAVSDRGQHDAWVQADVATLTSGDEEARATLAQHGIRGIAVCPVRSEVGASGALVAFYHSAIESPARLASLIGIAGSITSSTIAYALTIEQTSGMLDDLAGANQELSVQATVDGLTGLTNHRSMQQMLTEMCRPSRGSGQRVFCLVMVDVDHFKMYNDTHGHQEGDAALRLVAKVISAGLRQGDAAARYGGEEFALILRGVNKDSALGVADRIRRAVADQTFRKGSLTVSMGVAEFPADGSTPGEIIERADRALYHAKITGRNRVVGWGSSGCSLAGESPDAADSKAPRKTVLVVDRNDGETARVIRDSLSSDACTVEVSENTATAVEMLKNHAFSIALVSLEALPGGDIRALSTLSAIHPDMPIVLMTRDLPVEENREALRRGASDILMAPFNPAELPVVIERNLERRRLERQRLTQKSTGIMLQAIGALVAAIDAKDHYTTGHSQRVTALSLAISDELQISNEDRYALELAAKLHDIGKLGLPDSALNKQSPLTDEEWRAMREHPALGSKIVGAIDELGYVSTIIRHHHERLNGTGYPDGLSGEAIPHLARIIAVADAYEAMTSQRAYRSRLSPREAVEELRLHSGAYYSPEVVEMLEKHLTASGEIELSSVQDCAA